MTSFHFRSITPHPILAPYIAKMCVFESSGRLPALDKKLIVPNANFKLTFTYCNGIVARVDEKVFAQKENVLTLTGLIDSPVFLDPLEDTRTGTIIIEFNPFGVYRLFQLPYKEIRDQIIELSDLIGSRAEILQRQLAGAESVDLKFQLLQNFLIRQLTRAIPDPIYDHCINRISASKGLINVAQLEKETGYTARWLHRKFSKHLGSGPKDLSEMVRFRHFYQLYSTGIELPKLKDHIYSYYYDQSHFIRAFKRFTGHTPTDLHNSANELATKHYSS